MGKITNSYTLSVYEKALPDFLNMEEKFANAKLYGFDAFELSIDESIERQRRLTWQTKDILNLQCLSAEYDMPIHTICLSAHRRYPMGSRDKEIRDKSIEIIKKAIELASKVGVRVIQVAGYDVYYEQSDRQTASHFLSGLQTAVNYAAQYGVILAFVTMETDFMDTVEKAMKFVELVNSPYLQIYPDIGNLSNAAIKYQGCVVSDIAKGKGHIVAAHLKETAPGIYRNMVCGSGSTAYIPCIRQLWQEGVRKYTGEFWHLEGQDWRQNLQYASKFLREKIQIAAQERL